MRQEIVGQRRYCQGCPFYTRNGNTLSMHVARKHRAPQETCLDCFQLFTTKGALFHHVLSKHTEKTIKCTVETCPRKFKTKTNQRIHYMRNHTNLADYMQEVPYTHDEVINKKDTEYKCVACGKRGSQNTILYHVIQCSPLSPFSSKTIMECPPVLELEVCVLIQFPYFV
jgi:hypothetical protein